MVLYSRKTHTKKQLFINQTLGGKKMKAIHIFLTILIMCNINLFARHYIGQSELDQLKESKKSYVVGVKSTNFEVYLESANKEREYISDVLIDFDKRKYSRGETVTLTFKRTGANLSVINEQIAISGRTTNILGDGFELKTSAGYSIFYLKPAEVKRVFIRLKDKNQLIDRIQLGIGKIGIASEGRSYLIPYPPITNDNDNKNDTPSVKPQWEYYDQNNYQKFF